METKMRGKAWIFQGLLDVDWEICPFETLRQLRERGVNPTYEELGKYAMTKVDPEFPKKVNKGDFIVAGEGMGYGHDHDHACISLRGAGVAAVVCESSNSNFLRNCMDHGLPLIQCRGINAIVREGDELEIDLKSGIVKNLRSGEQLSFPPFPPFLLEMIQDGGLYPHLEKRIRSNQF